MENHRARRRSEQHPRAFGNEPGQGGKALDPDVELVVDLTAEEREVILDALVQWGGPARTELVIAMGFVDLEDFRTHCQRLMLLVRDGRPVRPWDWKRVLVSTEICFVSDYFGAGWDWETVTGLDDQSTLLATREIQDKVIGIAKGHASAVPRCSAEVEAGEGSV